MTTATDLLRVLSIVKTRSRFDLDVASRASGSRTAERRAVSSRMRVPSCGRSVASLALRPLRPTHAISPSLRSSRCSYNLGYTLALIHPSRAIPIHPSVKRPAPCSSALRLVPLPFPPFTESFLARSARPSSHLASLALTSTPSRRETRGRRRSVTWRQLGGLLAL